MTHDERRKRRKAIADYLAEGHSAGDAAAKFGVSRGTARSVAADHGIPAGPRRVAMAHVSAFSILKRLLDGGSLADLATEFGVTVQTVHRIRSLAEEAGFVFAKSTRGRPKGQRAGPSE
jgi:transposase